MFCHNCGNKINGDEKFCPACGTKLMVQADSENHEYVNPQKNYPPENTPDSTKSAPLSDVIANPFDNEINHSKLKKIIIMQTVSAVLVLFAYIVILLFPVLTRSNYIADTDTTETVKLSLVRGTFDDIKSLLSIFSGDTESNLGSSTLYGLEGISTMFEWLFILYAVLRIFICFYMITLAVKAAIKLFGKIKILFNLNEYCESELRKSSTEIALQDAVKTVKSKVKNRTAYEFFSNLILLFFFSGYRSLNIKIVAVAAVVMIVGLVLEKVSDSNKMKIFNVRND